MSEHCNHLQPGVVDFPARCADAKGHHGDHHSARRKVTVFDAEPLPPIYWKNDDE